MRKKLHSRILKGELKEQNLSTVLKSCPKKKKNHVSDILLGLC